MNKLKWNGTPISGGTGVGGVYYCKSPDIPIHLQPIPKEQVDLEVVNLEVAICKTFLELYDLYSGFSEDMTEEEQRIIEVYHAILDDIYFFNEMKQVIQNQFTKADYAIHFCIEKYIHEIENSDNEYMKLRISDFKDIRFRLLRNVMDVFEVEMSRLNQSHIAIVQELNPSLAMRFAKRKVKGVVAKEGGGYFSHAAIILRNLGIPIINNIPVEELEDHHGKIAILDGFSGTILIEPNNLELDEFKSTLHQYQIDLQESKEFQYDRETSMQGITLGISANLCGLEDFRRIHNCNINGVGLVRTETLFLKRRKMPSEQKQALVYRKIAKTLAPKPVVIRTADFGADKAMNFTFQQVRDSIERVRGIRWSLQQPNVFKSQIKAILRASLYNNIRILFPMVENENDIIEAKKILEECTEELQSEFPIQDTILVGAMIETKEAVKNLEAILQQVDFISIGTNDLMHQYLRFNRIRNALDAQEFFKPPFLKIVNKIIKTAKQKNIFVTVCGEMASDPIAAVVLFGMGVNEISIGPARIPWIRKKIFDVEPEMAYELSRQMLECGSWEEVKQIVDTFSKHRIG